MDYLKYNDINNINDYRVNEKIDYSQKDLIINEINLGKSNIIALNFRWGNYAIFRPSGTEPKFKVYLGAFCPENGYIDIVYTMLLNDVLSFVITFNKQ